MWLALTQQRCFLARLRRVAWKWTDQVQTFALRLMIAQLQMKLQRLCQRLVAQGRFKAEYSFHDLRNAFAETNAGSGLRWLQRRLGHAAIAISKRGTPWLWTQEVVMAESRTIAELWNLDHFVRTLSRHAVERCCTKHWQYAIMG